MILSFQLFFGAGNGNDITFSIFFGAGNENNVTVSILNLARNGNDATIVFCGNDAYLCHLSLSSLFYNSKMVITSYRRSSLFYFSKSVITLIVALVYFMTAEG
jgi:hypothetical protein